MRVLAAILLALGFAVFKPVAIAQEPAEKKAPAHEGTAHEGEKDMTLWKWANFAVLVGGLGYLVSKNAGPFFASRSAEIRKGIADAEQTRADAEVRAAAMDARMADLRSEIEALRKAATEEQAHGAERIQRETAAELAKIQAHSEREIASAGKAARAELKRYSAELALSLARQRIRERMSPHAQDLLVHQFAQRLSGPNA